MVEYDHVAYQKAYKKLIERIKFTETPGKNTVFWEFISYNTKIGTISYSSGFSTIGRHTLPVIDINGGINAMTEKIFMPMTLDQAQAVVKKLGNKYHIIHINRHPDRPEIQGSGWYIQKEGEDSPLDVSDIPSQDQYPVMPENLDEVRMRISEIIRELNAKGEYDLAMRLGDEMNTISRITNM